MAQKNLENCAGGKNERFGVIDFAIGCPVTAELTKSVLVPEETQWRKITPTSTQECALIPFAPNSLSFSKKGPEYRFIAIREPLCDADNTENGSKIPLNFPPHPISTTKPPRLWQIPRARHAKNGAKNRG